MIEDIKKILPAPAKEFLKPLWQKWKHRSGYRKKILLDEPIFVVGHPRSGTSWLNSLISAHPRLAGGPETHLFNLYLIPFFQQHHMDWIGQWIPMDYRLKLLRELADDIFAYRLAEEQKIRIVEKTPTHAHYIKEIKILYPRSKFIHIIRDGRDVAVSLFRSFTPRFEWAPKSASEAADRWMGTLEYVEDMKHQFPGDIEEVRYEDLAADSEKNLKKLFYFVGETPEKQLISQALRQWPPHKNSIGRWESELTEQQITDYEQKAGKWLERFGYKLDKKG